MQPEKFQIGPRPYLLKNKIQNYEWGTRGDEAIIPKLLGFEPEKEKPYAELWIGAHTKASSCIMIDDLEVSLEEIIKAHPEEILGRSAAERFDGRLPFLLKVLSAAEALSIQAHPDKTHAKILHAKDPKNYPDGNHKPEIAIALDSLHALVGLKPKDELLSVIRKYKGIEEFIGQKILSDAANSELSKDIYETIMKRSVSEPEKLEAAIKKVKEFILAKEDGSITGEEKLFLELEKKYGSDVGLFSILLFNHIQLKPGEGIFLNAGVPHAYLKGNIIECMASSDNVVRAGLTPKFKDIDSLLDILSYEPVSLKPINKATEPGEQIYPIPINEFEIKRWEFSSWQEKSLQNKSAGVILVAEGEVQIEFANETLICHKGDSVLIPARLQDYKIITGSNSLVFLVTIP